MKSTTGREKNKEILGGTLAVTLTERKKTTRLSCTRTARACAVFLLQHSRTLEIFWTDLNLQNTLLLPIRSVINVTPLIPLRRLVSNPFNQD